ncbi:beta-lactamase-like protein [Biscogniauxia marginata]|nr:beta-lactamase-like protein [Biscogniauxia marginata]
MADTKEPVYVTISALDAGHLTLPEPFFVTPADPESRPIVPSLSFLIQHPGRNKNDVTRIVFDLGVKRDLTGYTPAQQAHAANRQPIIVDPDCAASLRRGASEPKQDDSSTGEEPLLDPSKDIDVIILSHIHWDHVGTSSDFPSATFVVGSGTLEVLKNGAGPLYPAEMFNDDELPAPRTVEFPPVPTRGDDSSEYDTGPNAPRHTPASADTRARLPVVTEEWSWRPLAGFPHTLDFFGDGSLYVIDTPGHIYGHVNLFARIAENKYVYLGGDCCHDRRILSGERAIAMYDDGRGGLRSVHMHTDMAKKTLAIIGEFIKEKRDAAVEVEVVLAHDGHWRNQNRHRFWPGKL